MWKQTVRGERTERLLKILGKIAVDNDLCELGFGGKQSSASWPLC
jgi:hypothetical protein